MTSRSAWCSTGGRTVPVKGGGDRVQIPMPRHYWARCSVAHRHIAKPNIIVNIPREWLPGVYLAGVANTQPFTLRTAAYTRDVRDLHNDRAYWCGFRRVYSFHTAFESIHPSITTIGTNVNNSTIEAYQYQQHSSLLSRYSLKPIMCIHELPFNTLAS